MYYFSKPAITTTTTAPTSTIPMTTSTTSTTTPTPNKRCPDGFFNIGSKCYKIYTDTTRSWEAAKSKCEAEDLVLPTKTDDANILRKYIVDTYGDMWVWMGARGVGTEFQWVRSGDAISNTSPLWWNGQPNGNTGTDRCLLLTSNKPDWANQPTHPYYPLKCSRTDGGRHAMCEYKRCPDGFFNIGSKCYKIYTDTTRSWEAAKSKCEAEDLVLPTKTDDANILRKYIVDTYG
ncbi:unnamed protein product, partial [Meganyctiphanes norvegica]